MSPRYRIVDETNGFTVVFSPRRPWLLLVVPAFLSVIFFTVPQGVEHPELPFRQPAIEKSISLLLGRIAPFALAAVALGAFAWILFGREKVFIDGTSIIITQESMGVGRAREFTWNSVRNLRVRSRPDLASLQQSARIEEIAFDYGSRTYSFATGIGTSEGSDLVDRIRRRFQLAG